ncbi:MAG TPA: hypothetical protein VFG47_00985 [Geminicoccaceae bacterium]|nr:hypothetical protein [Geminicoccaceae bacterium]
MTAVGVCSRGIRAIPHVAAFLGADRLVFRPGPADAGGLDAVVGWGRRETARRAVAYAARHGLPYRALEDGFVRSLDLGVYYDAPRPSRLEALLNGAGWEDDDPMADARRAIGILLAAGISKYNAAPDPAPDLPPARP